MTCTVVDGGVMPDKVVEENLLPITGEKAFVAS